MHLARTPILANGCDFSARRSGIDSPSIARNETRRRRLIHTFSPPSDLAELVAELPLDDGRCRIRWVAFAGGHARLRYLLGHVEPQAVERHAEVPRQGLGGLPLLRLGEHRIEHDAVAGAQHP